MPFLPHDPPKQMEASPGHENGRSDRQLRIFTIAAIIPAFALLVPSGVVTYQPLPAIGLVPMAMSALLGLATLASPKMSTHGKTWADIVIAVSLLAVLIPSWDWTIHNPRFGTLCAYAMTPMMINLVIHIHFALLYLPRLFQPRTCPYCKHCAPDFPRWQAQRSVAFGNDANLIDQRQAYGHQPPHAVRGYVDEEARESSEYQTSGFGTPRQSVETLGSVEGRIGGDVVSGKNAASLV